MEANEIALRIIKKQIDFFLFFDAIIIHDTRLFFYVFLCSLLVHTCMNHGRRSFQIFFFFCVKRASFLDVCIE